MDDIRYYLMIYTDEMHNSTNSWERLDYFLGKRILEYRLVICFSYAIDWERVSQLPFQVLVVLMRDDSYECTLLL